ncbi:MAG: response regulator [Actinobacteria bacterium]|nr:response regulator [Actinomycetota bacterium]
MTLRDELHHRHGVIAPGDYAVLTLDDTGVGMSADTLAKLFEPFFTTKPEGEGTGLGLATVYGIIHQMHGHITVDSTLGQGSNFAVYLPRHQCAAAAPTYTGNEAGSAPMADGTPRTILVVDDELSIRDVARRVLTREGFRVLTAAHGVEALRLLERAQDEVEGSVPFIDLVLTDMRMPVMGGHELGEAIASRHPTVRVLYMSGYSADTLPDGRAVGGTLELLQKPFSVTELASAVVRAMSLSSAADSAA